MDDNNFEEDEGVREWLFLGLGVGPQWFSSTGKGGGTYFYSGGEWDFEVPCVSSVHVLEYMG